MKQGEGEEMLCEFHLLRCSQMQRTEGSEAVALLGWVRGRGGERCGQALPGGGQS